MKTQIILTLVTGALIYPIGLSTSEFGTHTSATNNVAEMSSRDPAANLSQMAFPAWESTPHPEEMRDEETVASPGGYPAARLPMVLAQAEADAEELETIPLDQPVNWEGTGDGAGDMTVPDFSDPESLMNTLMEAEDNVTNSLKGVEDTLYVDPPTNEISSVESDPSYVPSPQPLSSAESLVDPSEPADDLAPGALDDAATQIVSGDSGFWIRGAQLNDVFQYLAQLGNLQYFHNSDLDAPNFVVTGHLNMGDPQTQMEELGLMYGVTIYRKGTTVYAMTESQLAQLPTRPFQYQLKYLRPSDIDQIETILRPVLTPGTGVVDFETKTNTLIVIDNEQKVKDVQAILEELDKPKQQIAIETRILRIKSSSSNRIGVDWSTVLGEEGLTFEAEQALNALFNLPDSDTVTDIITTMTDSQGRSGFTIAENAVLGMVDPESETSLSLSSTIPESSSSLSLEGTVLGAGSLAGGAFEAGGSEGYSRTTESTQNTVRNGSGLVLSPLQLQATLRALNFGGLAQQESAPTLITEDNEQGVISIIDRVPIITSTISETDAGQNISEEVRYRVDEDDPIDDPTASREIGVSMIVVPTILPDGTIRMILNPRSAQIVSFVEGRTGNQYPRVNESTVQTIARVPNGHSLLVGGFYEVLEGENINKVPVLGDVPWLNFFFKSTEKTKEHTSLVFVVTPTHYEPVSVGETLATTKRLHDKHVLPFDHAWPDRQAPGFNYDSNLGWAIGNALDLYPDVAPSNALNPGHPMNLPPEVAENYPQPQAGSVEPVTAVKRDNAGKKGLFGRIKDRLSRE